MAYPPVYSLEFTDLTKEDIDGHLHTLCAKLLHDFVVLRDDNHNIADAYAVIDVIRVAVAWSDGIPQLSGDLKKHIVTMAIRELCPDEGLDKFLEALVDMTFTTVKGDPKMSWCCWK
jgi:hypothetical protein